MQYFSPFISLFPLQIKVWDQARLGSVLQFKMKTYKLKCTVLQIFLLLNLRFDSLFGEVSGKACHMTVCLYALTLDECSLRHQHFSQVSVLTHLLDILIAEFAGCYPLCYPFSLLIKKSLFMCPLIFISSQLQMAFLPFLVSLES